MTGIPTNLTVRVIARDGKFLGDDIGGAYVTVRDALTRRMLAEGATSGGSGLNGCEGVMCVKLRRGEPLPTTGASSFVATLMLDKPLRVEVTAYGPLGARQSANTVSATQWIYPGKNLDSGVGFLLELPGLITQIVYPPTHFAPKSAIEALEIRVNVAMMCGCPIDWKQEAKICPDLGADEQPWLPDEFEVAAVIRGQSGDAVEIPLQFREGDTAGQFAGVWRGPAAGIYEITVHAFQPSTGNTGVDTATVILPSTK